MAAAQREAGAQKVVEPTQARGRRQTKGARGVDGARLAEASAGSWRCEVGLLLPGRRVGGQGLLGGRGRRSGRKGVQGWGGRLELMAGGAAVHEHVLAGATPDAARRHGNAKEDAWRTTVVRTTSSRQSQ